MIRKTTNHRLSNLNCFKGLTPLLTPLNTIIHPYKLHDTELKTTNNAKYLGVTLNNDFNFSTHINNVSSKANNTLKFIKRNIKTKIRNLKKQPTIHMLDLN